MPGSQKTKTWNRNYIVTNSIKTLKMVHILKKKVLHLFPCCQNWQQMDEWPSYWELRVHRSRVWYQLCWAWPAYHQDCQIPSCLWKHQTCWIFIKQDKPAAPYHTPAGTGVPWTIPAPSFRAITFLKGGRVPLSHEKVMLVRDFPGSPVVKTSPPVQGVWVQSLVGELRSHMPRSQETKT